MRRLIVFVLFQFFVVSSVFSSELPGTSFDKEFDEDLENLNLEDLSRYEFTFKTSGTSIGFKIRKIGKRNKFVFLPENSATRLEGEIGYYRLSRILGVSQNFNPVGYYELGPQSIQKFGSMLRDESNRHRRKNTEKIRAMISSNPNKMLGVIKFRSKRDSQSVNALIRGNRFNTQHSIAKLIQGSGPQPGDTLISIPGVRREKPEHPHPQATELSLARQLSTIFVFDMLLGQWDRFSGGNIEAYAFKDGGAQFIGRDNGGSHLLWGDSWFDRYTRWVTRFDRDLVDQLQLLNDFLDGSVPTFKGYNHPQEFEDALGLQSSRSFAKFQGKLRRFVTEHVPKSEMSFGDDIYFKD